MKDQQVQTWGMLSHDQALSFHCDMHGQSRSPPCAMSACIGSTAVTVPSSSWSLCRAGAFCLPGGSTASAAPAKARRRLLLPDCAGPKTKHCTAHPSSKSHAARCRNSAVTRLPRCPWPEADLFLMARFVNHECSYIFKEHIMEPASDCLSHLEDTSPGTFRFSLLAPRGTDREEGRGFTPIP